MLRLGLFLLTAIAALAQQDTLQSKVLAKERQGLDCLKTGNLAEFAALTADDAVFVDAHGPADKAQVVKNTSEFRLDDYTIEDVTFVSLSSKSGLIAYTITEPTRLTENSSRRRCMSRLSGRSAKVSGSAYLAKRPLRDNLEVYDA